MHNIGTRARLNVLFDNAQQYRKKSESIRATIIRMVLNLQPGKIPLSVIEWSRPVIESRGSSGRAASYYNCIEFRVATNLVLKGCYPLEVKVCANYGNCLSSGSRIGPG